MLFLKQQKNFKRPSNVKRQTSNENSVNTLTPLSSVITKIILVIDDDVSTNFNLIINILSKFGLEVIVAHGNQEELVKTQVLSISLGKRTIFDNFGTITIGTIHYFQLVI